VPFYLTDDLHSIYQGSLFAKFFGLLNPFALLAGVVSAAMLITHGAAWLSLKAAGPVAVRARAIGSVTAILAILGYAGAGLWLANGIEGYAFVGEVVRDGPSNPLTFGPSNARLVACRLCRPALDRDRPGSGFRRAGADLLWPARRARGVDAACGRSLAIFGVISSVGLTMFPFILPSSIDPRVRWRCGTPRPRTRRCSSCWSRTVIFMPMILAYTAWVYRVLWGKVTEDDVTANSDSVY
jgi:cytochrome d ubiquinol oxidase subunit II